MTEDEKEEFLFRLRLLRTDAADDPCPEKGKGVDDDVIRKKSEKERKKADDEERLKRKRKEREEQAELDRMTREDMMMKSRRRNQGWSGNDFSDRNDDVLYEGLDS